jgi:hypothetical protein
VWAVLTGSSWGEVANSRENSNERWGFIKALSLLTS